MKDSIEMKNQNEATKPAASDAGDHWAERLNWLGRFPFPPQAKQCKVLRGAEKLTFMQGEEIKCVVDLFVSSDMIHFGIFYVPPFEAIEASAPHPGDECYYVLAGEGAVLISAPTLTRSARATPSTCRPASSTNGATPARTDLTCSGPSHRDPDHESCTILGKRPDQCG